jgi:type II secretory pathway component PulC
VSYRQIVDAHLYGSPSEEEAAAPVVVDAAQTTLDLRLLGVVSSTASGQARALIAVENAPGRYFSVNQLISGTDARIRDITADQVLIERGGRLERVLLWSPENMARANEGAQMPALPGVAAPPYPDLNPATPPPASLLPIPPRAGAAHDTP